MFKSLPTVSHLYLWSPLITSPGSYLHIQSLPLGHNKLSLHLDIIPVFLHYFCPFTISYFTWIFILVSQLYVWFQQFITIHLDLISLSHLHF